MPAKNFIDHIALTNPGRLQTLVENRRVFNLENCEMNVYESYQESYRVPLTFNDFVITSMVRGKKIMHLADKPAFDYLPGETVIVPAHETMIIDFPEATETTPSQCIALALDKQHVTNTLQYLNTFYNVGGDQHEWRLQLNQYHFDNDNEVSELINKLIRICSSEGITKNIFADLNVKELLIRLVQSQHLFQVAGELTGNPNQTRQHYVLHYIQEHLTEKIAVDTLSRKAYLSRNMFFRWFREQFGVTPLDYINQERIKLAKQLLTSGSQSVTSVSQHCGFTDVNYFVRLFRKTEGITPGQYRACSPAPHIH